MAVACLWKTYKQQKIREQVAHVGIFLPTLKLECHSPVSLYSGINAVFIFCTTLHESQISSYFHMLYLGLHSEAVEVNCFLE